MHISLELGSPAASPAALNSGVVPPGERDSLPGGSVVMSPYHPQELQYGISPRSPESDAFSLEDHEVRSPSTHVELTEPAVMPAANEAKVRGKNPRAHAGRLKCWWQCMSNRC